MIVVNCLQRKALYILCLEIIMSDWSSVAVTINLS